VVSFKRGPALYDRDRRLQGVFAVCARTVTSANAWIQVAAGNRTSNWRTPVRAEKANLANRTFLSSMEHELRSPLNAILGFAQLMSSDSRRQRPSRRKHRPDSSGRMASTELINEILDLAKVEFRAGAAFRGTGVVGRKSCSNAQGMIEPQAQQHGITLTFPRFDIPQFVRADRTG